MKRNRTSKLKNRGRGVGDNIYANVINAYAAYENIFASASPESIQSQLYTIYLKTDVNDPRIHYNSYSATSNIIKKMLHNKIKYTDLQNTSFTFKDPINNKNTVNPFIIKYINALIFSNLYGAVYAMFKITLPLIKEQVENGIYICTEPIGYETTDCKSKHITNFQEYLQYIAHISLEFSTKLYLEKAAQTFFQKQYENINNNINPVNLFKKYWSKDKSALVTIDPKNTLFIERFLDLLYANGVYVNDPYLYIEGAETATNFLNAFIYDHITKLNNAYRMIRKTSHSMHSTRSKRRSNR
jgi:hypothetical protein